MVEWPGEMIHSDYFDIAQVDCQKHGMEFINLFL